MEAVLAPKERVMDRAGADDFSSWVEPHLPAMHRLAARLTDPGAADDVVQEALVRAWRRRSTYDEGRGAAAGWLLAIVADRARRHRTRTRVHASLDAVPEDGAPDASRDLDLERAVAGLSGRQRLAVELYYFVGADVATCAAAMGCAEGTVRATLHQARLRLRDLIGDER
jgi:RNA polymerase sigma factor (sigma-70 family)